MSEYYKIYPKFYIASVFTVSLTISSTLLFSHAQQESEADESEQIKIRSKLELVKNSSILETIILA